MLSSFFAQFRHQYANGSLTTELLMPHAEQYLVKATVTIGEQILATALAADASLTVADDQAKSRVLALLGFGQETAQTTHSRLSTPHPVSTEPSRAEKIAHGDANGNAHGDTQVNAPTQIATASNPVPTEQLPKLSLTPPVIEPVIEPAAIESTAIEPAAIDDIDDAEDIGRPIDSIAPDEAPAPAEVPASSLAAEAIENFDDTNPVDLSDVIAQTDVEMTRLGWSSIQGRNYLEQTFSKRSRQQLTDEEILTFLLYLEEQPTPRMG